MNQAHTPTWLKELIRKRRFKDIFSLFAKKDRFVELFDGTFHHQKSTNVIVLEGLPGSGKTTILNMLNTRRIKLVPQIVLDEIDGETETFWLQNDIEKCDTALRAIMKCCVMDRNFVSTLAYNYSPKEVQGKNIANN